MKPILICEKCGAEHHYSKGDYASLVKKGVTSLAGCGLCPKSKPGKSEKQLKKNKNDDYFTEHDETTEGD